MYVLDTPILYAQSGCVDKTNDFVKKVTNKMIFTIDSCYNGFRKEGIYLMKKYFGFGIVVVTAMICMIYPMVKSITGNEMGYTIFAFYILYQAATLIGALLMKGSEFLYKAVFVIVAGALGLLAPLVVFHSFSYVIGLIAAVVAIVAQIVSALAFKE